MSGALIIPPGYSRRVLAKGDPRVAFVENNGDRFVSCSRASSRTENPPNRASSEALRRSGAAVAVTRRPFYPPTQRSTKNGTLSPNGVSNSRAKR